MKMWVLTLVVLLGIASPTNAILIPTYNGSITPPYGGPPYELGLYSTQKILAYEVSFIITSGNLAFDHKNITFPANFELPGIIIKETPTELHIAAAQLFGASLEPVQLVDNISISGSGTFVIYDWYGGHSLGAFEIVASGHIDADGDVDLYDFAHLAGQWQQAPGLPPADIAPVYGDGMVDILDLAVFVNSWLDNSPTAIAIYPATFNLFVVDGSNTNQYTLNVRNAGEGTLNWQITHDCNWLYVDPNTGSSTGEANEVELTVDTAGLELGTYNCDLTILDPNAANNPQTVTVNLTVGNDCWDCPCQTYGDSNCDGFITPRDLPPMVWIDKCYDLNHDGFITAMDILILVINWEVGCPD